MLMRALTVLEAFGTEATLGVADLGRRVGLPRATVHRIVAELIDLGLLERVGKDVTLGVRLFELGSKVPTQRRLREVGLPYMQDLCATTRLAAHLGVPDGNDVLCIARLSGHHGGSATLAEGARIPLHATALGKAILAFSALTAVAGVAEAGLHRLTPYTIAAPTVLLEDLARIRRTGVAFDREEARLGEASVASPIIDPQGNVVAALSLIGSVHHFEPSRAAQAVRAAAAGVSRELSTTGRMALVADAGTPMECEIAAPVAS